MSQVGPYTQRMQKQKDLQDLQSQTSNLTARGLSIPQANPPDQENRESGLRNPICHCSEVRNVNSHVEFVSHSLIVPSWLHHESNPDNKIMIYALLDDQSDACFIKTSALEKLNVDGPKVHLRLYTVLAEEDITSEKITGLVVRGVNEGTDICLPRTYSRDIIPAKRSQIPRPETARKWPHLRRIADNLRLAPRY